VSTATATPIPVTPSLAPSEPGLFFRMQSDWGSAFPKQDVNYVIAAQNTRASGDMRDLRISAAMPANLEVLSASASYGTDPRFTNVDPAVAGNNVSLKLDNLKPGEQVIIAIKTRVRASVAIGTRIVSQAELTFTGIKLPAYSNIVTVLIVGAAPTQVALVQATTTVTPTLALSMTATPSATATATMTATPPPSPTSVPAPTALPPASAAGAAAPPRAPLPETSTGVPIFGFVLLGMTMMLRTMRVHRAQSRI
jgi:hypothetical protein